MSLAWNLARKAEKAVSEQQKTKQDLHGNRSLEKEVQRETPYNFMLSHDNENKKRWVSKGNHVFPAQFLTVDIDNFMEGCTIYGKPINKKKR